jgi:integrase
MSIRPRGWRTSKGKARTAYVFDYTDLKGDRHQITRETKKAVVEEQTRVMHEIGRGVHTAPSASITVNQAIELWIENAESPADGEACAPLTVDRYRSIAKHHIADFLGSKKLSELTVPMIGAYETALRKGGRTPATIKKARRALGSLIANAIDAGYNCRNVVRDCKRRGGRKSSIKNAVRRKEVGIDIPTPEEIGRLLGSVTGKGRPIIVASIYTGMRIGELRALRWDDVDLEAREIQVQQAADRWNNIGAPKSEAGVRRIPLPQIVVNTLREWKLACPRHPERGLWLVFPNASGGIMQHTNVYQRVYMPAWESAGITRPTGRVDEQGRPILRAKYGIHALRHFYASWLLAGRDRGGAAVSDREAQTYLGHAKLAMTLDTYGHLLPAKDDRAAVLTAAEIAPITLVSATQT